MSWPAPCLGVRLAAALGFLLLLRFGFFFSTFCLFFRTLLLVYIYNGERGRGPYGLAASMGRVRALSSWLAPPPPPSSYQVYQQQRVTSLGFFCFVN